MTETVNPPGPGGVIHRVAGGGYTSCRIWIPDLPAADRHWAPYPGDMVDGREPPIGPVTCPHCIAGTPAPVCSTDPAALTLWTIYSSPRDCPGEHVAREWRAMRGREVPGLIVARGRTLAACRAALDDHLRGVGRGGLGYLCRMPRALDDDPVIVESWL